MIKVFEAFAGIGTQRMALRNLNISHDVVAISEIDKFAIKSYEAIHGKTKNLGDVSKIDVNNIPNHDLFTYSFPCQDISVAGKGEGLKKGSKTRSSLLWECERIIEHKRPKYLLMENVKNLVSKKHKHNFEKWLEILEDYGYTNYWKVLNAKDYGVPQNRERVFVVSILGDHRPYEFPKPMELKLKLKDVLENDVDEKFYLSDKNIKMLIKSDTGNYPRRKRFIENIEKNNNISNTIQTRQRTSPTDQYVADEQTIIKIKNATKKGYLEAKDEDGNDLAFPNSKTRMGRVQKEISQTLDTGDTKGVVIGASRGRNPNNPSDRTPGIKTEQKLEINTKGTSNTITSVQKDNLVIEPTGTLAAHNSNTFGSGYMDGVSKTLKAEKHDISVVYSDLSIRKLTPLECWRLMGISDEDFYKAQKVNSNTQLYKQAGNAIVVDVLEAIFRNLFVDEMREE